MIALYSFAIGLVVWLVLVPIELLRIAARRSTLQTLAERLGRLHIAAPKRRRILIHAVSAGEMNAASALVHELARRDCSFVLSAGNADARRTALRIRSYHSEVDSVVAAPWDRRNAMRRWLTEVRCDAVIVIETEIWPNLFVTCREMGIPLVIAGARIDRRACARYRMLRFFFADVLAAAEAIVAVDEVAKRRYLAIGAPAARATAGGNLKPDACLIVHDAADRVACERKVVAAVNTHPGEEALIGNALRACGDVDLVFAPRHVRRASAVRRSTRATVVDRMGMLARVYANADVVIIGGTFVDAGGHDVFEAARAGCAIVVGPHIDSIRDSVTAMLERNAIRTATAESLPRVVASLLNDAADRERLRENARAFAASRSGAAARCANLIEALFAPKAKAGCAM